MSINALLVSLSIFSFLLRQVREDQCARRALIVSADMLAFRTGIPKIKLDDLRATLVAELRARRKTCPAISTVDRHQRLRACGLGGRCLMRHLGVVESKRFLVFYLSYVVGRL